MHLLLFYCFQWKFEEVISLATGSEQGLDGLLGVAAIIINSWLGFPSMGGIQNGWFIRGNPIKMDEYEKFSMDHETSFPTQTAPASIWRFPKMGLSQNHQPLGYPHFRKPRPHLGPLIPTDCECHPEKWHSHLLPLRMSCLISRKQQHPSSQPTPKLFFTRYRYICNHMYIIYTYNHIYILLYTYMIIYIYTYNHIYMLYIIIRLPSNPCSSWFAVLHGGEIHATIPSSGHGFGSAMIGGYQTVNNSQYHMM